MTQKTQEWFRAVPIWAVLILLSIIAFFMTREIRVHDENHLALTKAVADLSKEVDQMRTTQLNVESGMKMNQVTLRQIQATLDTHLKNP